MTLRRFPALSLALVAAVACVAPPVAISGVVEVPLDAVVGPDFWDVQELDFDLGGTPVGLSRVGLRLVGECGDQAYVTCMNMQYAGMWPASIELALYGEAGGAVIDVVPHDFPAGPAVPVDLQWTFNLSAPGALASLADGAGRVVLSDLASMFDDGSGVFYCPVDVACELESVTLIMEYDLLVADEVTSWGQMKGMFR